MDGKIVLRRIACDRRKCGPRLVPGRLRRGGLGVNLTGTGTPGFEEKKRVAVVLVLEIFGLNAEKRLPFWGNVFVP